MRALRIIPLEERILLDAAVAHDVAAVAGATATAGDGGVHVLVVPTNVPDAVVLENAANHNVVVVSYDPSTTNLATLQDHITQAAGDEKVESIGFVNDGSVGHFRLTQNDLLNHESLAGADASLEMIQFWQGISDLLTPTGHIDLMGCQVGQGEVGQNLLQALQDTINSDGSNNLVFGSINDTGSVNLGADWILEAPTTLDAGALYFQQDALEAWDHVLGTFYRNFSLRFSDVTHGDLFMAANTSMYAQDAGSVTSTIDPVDVTMVNVDNDGITGTFNSTMSHLTLPGGSTVTFAGLYWGGKVDAVTPSGDYNVPDSSLIDQVLFRLPGSLTYVSVDSVNFDTTGTSSGHANYQNFADVTSLVQSGGAGDYWVANIQTTSGITNVQAGWTLIVAYDNPTSSLKSLTVYDGYYNSLVGTTSDTFTLSGMQTPLSGTVTTEVGIVAYNGDSRTGDSLDVNGALIGDALNPTNNIFNGTISTNGVYDTLKNPDYTNNLGHDSKTILMTDILGLNETSADISFIDNQSTGNVFAVGALTFSTALSDGVATPVQVHADLTPATAGIHSGDTVQYTITVTGSGDTETTNLVLHDVIPANATYVANSMTVNGVAKTDASGDDQAEISGSNLTFRLGTGADSANGGTLASGDQATVTFKVLIDPNAPPATVIDNVASTTYTSVDGQVIGSIEAADDSFSILNDAPINTVPAAQIVNEDTFLVFSAANGNPISISDPDIGGNLLQVTLSVSGGGGLSLKGTTGLSFLVGDGFNDASMTLQGNLTDINNALNGLTYAPDGNYFGPASIRIITSDGVNTADNTINITINAQNDAPSFLKGPDITISEDSGAKTFTGWATNIGVGPTNETGQTASFLVSNDNNALFSVQPTISSTGTLAFTPAANAFGTATVTVQLQDSGGTANGGVDKSVVQTFLITINPINDAPSFTKGANQTVLEDAGPQTIAGWATNVSPGANEGSQAVNFIVTNNNNALFSIQPFIDANGTLTYTTAANTSGTATVSVRIHDNGGTANGGVDTSAIQTFTITTTAVNDAPSFTKGIDQVVNEDSATVTMTNWATNLSKGPSNEAGQTLSFVVTNNNNALFSTQPTINSLGTLTFKPATNAFGSATVTVQIQDNGGTTNGGVNISAPQTFNITVNPVNDAPTITTPSNTFGTGGVPVTIANFANITAGPANETGQNLSISTTTNHPEMFSVLPTVDLNGTLSYTLANLDYAGQATVSVTVRDNGGTALGGNDTTVRNFVISTTRDFTSRFQAEIQGDIAMASNTILTNPSNPTNNNNGGMVYVDIDGNLTTFNSSSADLIVPDGSNIVFAGLYWGGSYVGTTFNAALHDHVLLQTPDGTGYVTITSDTVPDNGAKSQYVAFADVTDLVRASGEGTYTVADLLVAQGGGFGGWTLIVAFENNQYDMHSINIYDGFIRVASNSRTITLDNFDTASVGTIDTKLALVAYEGDKGQQDSLLIHNGVTSQVYSDALLPSNDFFNSTITDGSSYALGRNPSFVNNYGFDAKMLDVSNYFLNNQTSVDLTFSSPTEDYTINVLALSTTIDRHPSGIDDNYTLNEDHTLTVAAPGVLSNDSDPESQPITVSLVSGVQHGTLTLNPDGSFTYTPQANYNGLDSFQYQVIDAKHQPSNIATVTLNITAVDDIPNTPIPESAPPSAPQPPPSPALESPPLSSPISTPVPPPTQLLVVSESSTTTTSTSTNDNGSTAESPMTQAAPEPIAVSNAGNTVTADNTAATSTVKAPLNAPARVVAAFLPGSQTGITQDQVGESASNISFNSAGQVNPFDVASAPYDMIRVSDIQIGENMTVDFGFISNLADTVPTPEEVAIVRQSLIIERETQYHEEIITHATPTASGLVTALMITDMSYPGLNRRGAFIIPCRVSEGGILVSGPNPPQTWKGSKATIQFKLNNPPTAKVILSLSSSDITLGSVAPKELVFTSTNWNIPQEVIVNGESGQGKLEEKNALCYEILIAPVQSSDLNFREYSVDPIKIWAIEPPHS